MLNIQNCVLNIHDSGQIMRLQRSKWVLSHGKILGLQKFDYQSNGYSQSTQLSLGLGEGLD